MEEIVVGKVNVDRGVSCESVEREEYVGLGVIV